MPLSVYPVNELWNLVPADPQFNRHKKRDRLPSSAQLQAARCHLEWDYGRYELSPALSQALQDDVRIRFSSIHASSRLSFPKAVASVVVDLIEQVAESRNLARFS